ILLIVLAVAALTLPPVFGIMTESQVYARIDALRANETLAVQVEFYERGWFSSSALLSITPRPPAAPPASAAGADAETLTVAVDFSHGPVSLRYGFFLGASEFLAYPVNPLSAYPVNAPNMPPPRGGNYAFEFHGQTTFGGALNFVAELPPLEREID